MKRAIVLLMVGLLILSYPVAAQSDMASERLFALADRFLNALAESEFEKAASMFHCPEEYGPMAREHEYRELARALRLISNELGPIIDRLPCDSLVPVYILTLESADSLYWSMHPNCHLIGYEVHFRDAGPGYAIFQFPADIAPDQIRAFAVALPESDPESVPRLERLIEELSEASSEAMHN